MTAAAVLLSRNIDPIGVPWMAAEDQLTRDVWMATINRAASLEEAARR